jgi:ATP-dependent DNA helicase RecQ
MYEFQIANLSFDPLIKMLLRLYGGELYSGFVKISETYLARALKVSVENLVSELKHLDQLQIAIYKPVKDQPQITFVQPRQDADRLPVDVKRMKERKDLAIGKMKAMISFVSNSHQCRMQFIRAYFGEDTDEVCHICDVCVAKRKKENHEESTSLRDEVLLLLTANTMSVEQLEERIAPNDRELFVDVVREMVDNGEIVYDEVWRLRKK